MAALEGNVKIDIARLRTTRRRSPQPLVAAIVTAPPVEAPAPEIKSEALAVEPAKSETAAVELPRIEDIVLAAPAVAPPQIEDIILSGSAIAPPQIEDIILAAPAVAPTQISRARRPTAQK